MTTNGPENPETVSALHFDERDWTLEADELHPDLLTDLLDCHGPGDALPAVEYVLDNWPVSGDAEICRALLRPYGAWDEDELLDHRENLRRLVWLTGCALGDGESAYFSGC